MIIELSPFVIGLLASVVTEVLKLVPALANNQLTKAITAIAVMVVGTYAFTSDLTLSSFGLVLLYCIGSYTAIVKPSATALGLTTQK